MNQESKKWPGTIRYWLGGLLFIIMIPIAYCFMILIFVLSAEFLKALEMEMIALWVIGSLFSIWFITSPLICLYWLFKPAEWFWWKHKYISHTIFYGSFFGCAGVIMAGVHFLLWFFPDGKIAFQARFFIAGAIGIIATFALWDRLYQALEQKRQKHREKRIDWEFQKQKRSLLKGETTLAPFIEEIKKLENLEKENKLSPFLEERLIALERVCDVLNVRWRQEGAPRVANIHKNYDDPTDTTPNDYGYDGIDEPIKEVDWITEYVFNDFVKSQQKGNVQKSRAQKQCLKDSLTNKLTRPERLIIVLYYYEKMTIKQIAEELKLSEARVSQMHSSIIARLKAQMKKINPKDGSAEENDSKPKTD